MRVRDACLADLARILEITNEAIVHTTANWSLEPTTLDERHVWFSEHTARGNAVLVAESDDGRVIGFAAYGAFRPKPGYRYTVEHSVYVDAAERGQGIGKGLLIALIERARTEGVHAMIGGIDADNEVSLRLHKSLGFEPTGTLREVGRKFDRWLDLVFVERLLGS